MRTKSASYSSPQDDEGQIGLPDIGIPAEVLFNNKLTNTEKILFGFIRNLSQSERGCYATNDYLGKLIQSKSTATRTSIYKLRDFGYIYIETVKKVDGVNERRIFIDPSYLSRYRHIALNGNKEMSCRKTDIPLSENRHPPAQKPTPPLSENRHQKMLDEDVNNKNTLPAKNFAGDETEKNEKIKPFIPYAKRLAKIIQENKNIKITPSQIIKWAKEIRKLETSKGVSIQRIRAAMQWYEKNAGGQYVPVIESGASFYDKFIKLEAAIERDKQKSPAPKQSAAPSPSGRNRVGCDPHGRW